MNVFNELLDHIPIPRMVRARQSYDRPVVADPEAEFLSRLRDSGVLSAVRKGMTIAIAVGSRGISNQPRVVRALVAELKTAGAQPFLFPAMGSHGGATAEGQKSMLEGLGFEERYIGAPIRATMETVEVGSAGPDLPALVDRFAYEADGIVLVNRIKPHVAFRGAYESGLAKMIAIGVGKQKGAEICHDLGFGRMAEHIPAIARTTLARTNILFAVGLLENAYHETARIEVLPAAEILEREPALQEEAKRLSPRLAFDRLDVLVMDEIGKDISGTGFDTNVAGRYHTPYITGGPQIARLVVLDLTDVSHGNGNGLGIVDFTTRRVFEKFRFDQTYPNSLTSTVPASVKIPMVLENDRHAFQAAIRTTNLVRKEEVRLVRIKNTIAMDEIEISENLVDEARRSPYLEVISGPFALPFDAHGNLL
ncbi:MAG: lactate racemase domain-containing protein [Verrucomicrobiota bacterium]